jgi:type II secretion system protein H
MVKKVVKVSTPISIAGTVKPVRNNKQAGFTLVEVLVSMLIISLMTGLVVLNLPQEKDPLTGQVQLLAKRLEIASSTSMIENNPIGIRFNEEGYQAVRYIGGEWKLIEQFEFETDSAPQLELKQNGAKIDIEKAYKNEVPVIRYDSTGLATPFELTIDVFGDSLRIEGAADGSVSIGDEDAR